MWRRPFYLVGMGFAGAAALVRKVAGEETILSNRLEGLAGTFVIVPIVVTCIVAAKFCR